MNNKKELLFMILGVEFITSQIGSNLVPIHDSRVIPTFRSKSLVLCDESSLIKLLFSRTEMKPSKLSANDELNSIMKSLEDIKNTTTIKGMPFSVLGFLQCIFRRSAIETVTSKCSTTSETDKKKEGCGREQ